MLFKTTVFFLLSTCLNLQATTLPSYAQSFVRAFSQIEENVLEGPALKNITDELSVHHSRRITQFVADTVTQFSKPGSAQKMLDASLRNGAAPDTKQWSILMVLINRYLDENPALLTRLTGLKSQELSRTRSQLILFYTGLVTSEMFATKQILVAPETVATLLVLTVMKVGGANKIRIASTLADLHELRPQLVGAIQMLWTTAVRLDCSQVLLPAPETPVQTSAVVGLVDRLNTGRSSRSKLIEN